MRNKKNKKGQLDQPLLGEFDGNGSFDEEKSDGTYTGPEAIKVEELTLPLSSDEDSSDDEEKGLDSNIGPIEETSSLLFLDDEEKGGQSTDTVLPTNNDAIKLLETCLSLNEGGAITRCEMRGHLSQLLIRLAHAANYYEAIGGVDRLQMQGVIRKFDGKTTNVFTKNEQNQEHFKVAYYLFFKIFNAIMRQNFDNSITVLDYSSPMNRATMSSDIDALLNETKKSFEPYEAFVDEQMDLVKMQWTELLENLRDDRIQGCFRGDIENVLDILFENIFSEIDNARSMDALEGVLNNRRPIEEESSLHYDSEKCLGNSRSPYRGHDSSLAVLGFLLGPLVVYGAIIIPNSEVKNDSGGMILMLTLVGPLLGAPLAQLTQDILWPITAKIFFRSANTWRESFINALHTMQTVHTDAVTAIHAKQTELFGRGGATAVEAHRASIRQIERGEQQFEKCMEFITSFYVLQASHPDGLEKLQKPQEQLALLRYRNEPIAQQTHKEYIQTASDSMGDKAWLRRQGVGFAIDDAPVYNEEEGDINSTSFGSLLSCGVMSSIRKDESSIMYERTEEKEEEDEEEADIENQCYTYPK